ncbi:hypothetical protein JRO89_XS01G0257700 [Xanthoceras sorbifolium]|uniref:BSD domain-containing protein n=1 Tax=Xanthoceras sorbifolium TaxID=99658 RepID=A0ABQ8ILD5_9ROSI|nr:hypothetical protein JRO89_XS01G0257700 [Xanthoceras sorbifolium]
MDFFKTVFADDPDPPTTESESESEPESKSPKNNQQQEENPDSNSPPNSNPSSAAGGWSFGGIIKTLSSKSESVLETYRRDLQEFGSGLKKEIEVAQGSLGTVSTAIDEIGSSVLKGTAQIISQGKEAILAIDHESDSSDSNLYSSNNLNNSGQQKKYSRFDAQVRAIQGDVNTYCEEVDDLDDYKKWKSGLVLDDMSEEIESLFEENGAMESIYQRVVPNSVDHETFWCRYFYRVFKLKQAEDLRANLVKRAISREEDEDLSWDVDDEDEDRDETESDVAKKVNLMETEAVSSKVSEQIVKEKSLRADEKEEKISRSNVDEVGKGNVAESSDEHVVNENVDKEKIDGLNQESVGLKSDEKVSLAAKTDPSESSKGSDFSVVSSQPSMAEEEDLGWDEIEDLSSIDDKKVTHGGSPSKADLRKRLSAAEEEEDLSWDIEDEDEPVKS